MISLDKIDYLILKALIEDGRTSYSNIAKETRLTDVAIKKRVESLKKRGIVSSITAEINYNALGFENPIYVQIRSELSKNKDLIKKIESFDFATELYQVLGEYNLLAKLVLPSLGDAEKFIEKLGSLDGIIDIKTLVVLSKLKKSNSLPGSVLQKTL